MNDTPEKLPPAEAATPDEGTANSIPQIPMAPRKPGLFQRLFSFTPASEELSIAIVPFMDAVGIDHAREIAAVFQNLEGVRVRVLKEKSLLYVEPEPVDTASVVAARAIAAQAMAARAENLPAACAQAMNWIGDHKADLVIWGDIPPPGTTLFIHFAAPPPVDADPAGTISPFQALTLPVEFDAEAFGGLVLATALAAMNVEDDIKIKKRRDLVADALERATLGMGKIPRDFTAREQASVHAAYANALASFGHLFPGGELYHRAILSYTQAIKGTLRSDSPANWAYLQRNLGTILQAMGERADDADLLGQAAAAYRLALEVFTLENTPFPWATINNRLGEVLYRLDVKTEDTDGLKLALAAYQGALKVLSRSATPLLWSNVMNNLGQAAQVLGRAIDNKEIVERAVAACEQALKVRSLADHPTLWASTQNNMGSALFLLGRMTRTDVYYQKALDAFMGARDVYEMMGLTRMVEVTDKNIQHAQSRLPAGERQSGSSDWWLEGEEDGKTP